MNYTVDKVEQLSEAQKLNRFGSVASLRAQGVTAKQHNVDVSKTSTKKPAKKTSAAKTQKTAATKKVSAKPQKKAANQRAANQKTTTKKS